MKKISFQLVAVIIALTCGIPGIAQDKTAINEKVETVNNPLKPTPVPGQPCKLTLEKEFSIDLMSKEILEQGLTDPMLHDVDDSGSIFIQNQAHNQGDRIFYKFNSKGKFVASFGRYGQMSGEIIGNLIFGGIDENNRLHLTNYYKRCLWYVFSGEGKLLKTNEVGAQDVMNIVPLTGGWYIVDTVDYAARSSSPILARHTYTLCDSRLNELKVLAAWDMQWPGRGALPRYRIKLTASDKHIFVGDPAEGYMIRVFNLEGNPVRVVRKDYEKVPMTTVFKNDEIESINNAKKQYGLKNVSYVFSKHVPAFYNFAADEDGRIYVMRYVNGRDMSDRSIDVFNQDGVCIGEIKCSFGNVIVKDGRFYCREKKNKLVVYKMKWE